MAHRKPAMDDAREIERWFGRLRRAEKVREQADENYGYTRALQQYRGDYISAMPSFVADANLVPINEVWGFAKTFVPSVYSRDPHLSVTPAAARGAAAARLRELFLNGYWRELRLKREVRRVILDAVLAEGWIKLGYSIKTSASESEPNIEPSEFIQQEEIFAARVSWHDMLRDPDAIDGVHDARWVAQRILRPLEAIKKSGLYDHVADLQPRFLITEPARPQQLRPGQEDQVEYAELWEIWDRDSGRVRTVAPGLGQYLRDIDWPYDLEGFPYVLLRFSENPDSTYAPNLIGAWEPQLWEKMKLRAMVLDHVKRFNRQLSVEEGAMSRPEIQKLEQGRTGSVTLRKRGTQVPTPLPYPQVQSDIYAVENRIDLDKDNISGQPNAVRSAPQRTQSRTLGEIDRLIAAFQARQGEPQTLVEEFAEEVGYKLLKLAAQFLPGERYVRATQRDLQELQRAFADEAEAPVFDDRGFNITRRHLRGLEFEVKVRSGTTLPLNREGRIEAASSLLKLGPTLGVMPGGLVARTLGKILLGEFELPEVEAAFDREMAMLEAERQLGRAAQQARLSEADLQLHNLAAQGANGGM